MKSFSHAVALAAVLASNAKAQHFNSIARMLSENNIPNVATDICAIEQQRNKISNDCEDICKSDEEYRYGSCVRPDSPDCRFGETEVDGVCISTVILQCSEGQILFEDQCSTVADQCGDSLSYFRGTCYDPNSNECVSSEIYTGNEVCVEPCETGELFINDDCYAEDEIHIRCNFDQTAELVNDEPTCSAKCSSDQTFLNGDCVTTTDDLCPQSEVYFNGLCVQQALLCSQKGQLTFEGKCIEACLAGELLVNGKCVNYCPEGQEWTFDLTCEPIDNEYCDNGTGRMVDGSCALFDACDSTQTLYRGQCYDQAGISEICGVDNPIVYQGRNCQNRVERCYCGVFGDEPCRALDFSTNEYVDCVPTSEENEIIKEEICEIAPTKAADAMIDCSVFQPLPGFDALDGRGTTYDRPVALTADGQELSLVRLTGTTTTRRRRLMDAEPGSKGPVLLTHGIGNDGSIWLSGPQDQPSLPETLFDAGYDVWIFNGRGTVTSRFNPTASADPQADEPQQWDFGVDELAKEDIKAAINLILTTRQADTDSSCQKVKVVTEGNGGALLSILMNDLPESSQQYIELALNQGFCPVLGRDFAVNPSPAEEADSNATEEENWSYYSYYYSGFDRDAYYAAFAEIRAELDYHTYHEFYYAYRQWESANYHDWWKNGKWQEGIDQALCEVKPSDLRCIPSDLLDLIDFSNAIDELGIVSLFGTAWTDTDAEAVCEKTGEENYLCQQLKDGYLSAEISAETFKTIAQQAYLQQWAKFNPDFSTNGWVTKAETYSADAINVPVFNWFAQDEESCPADLSKQIGDSIPTQSRRLTFTNGVDNAGMIAQVSTSYNKLLEAVLDSANTQIEGDCSTLVFDEWK